MHNFKKIILSLFIVTSPLAIQPSHLKVTPEEIRKYQITPLHKATTIKEIDEILQYGPNINAQDKLGRTPTDCLVKRALNAKINNDIDEFHRYINTAMHLVGKGGNTGNKLTAQYLFNQLIADFDL